MGGRTHPQPPQRPASDKLAITIAVAILLVGWSALTLLIRWLILL